MSLDWTAESLSGGCVILIQSNDSVWELLVNLLEHNHRPAADFVKGKECLSIKNSQVMLKNSFKLL